MSKVELHIRMRYYIEQVFSHLALAICTLFATCDIGIGILNHSAARVLIGTFWALGGWFFWRDCYPGRKLPQPRRESQEKPTQPPQTS